jgi:putative ribosome biogenesis GTPase RsgA
VVVAYGNSGVVELASGERRACKFRRSVGRPYCGDRVEVERADGDSLVVSAIQPRDNEFVRAGPRGQKQAIAANLDQALMWSHQRELCDLLGATQSRCGEDRPLIV